MNKDCINRKEAIAAMQDKAKKLKNEDTINGLCGAVAILYDLPSTEKNDLDKLSEQIKELKNWQKTKWGCTNNAFLSVYTKGYIVALSVVEGMIAELRENEILHESHK